MSPWLFLLLSGVVGSTLGARILGIFPTPSISHQQPFQAVMKALAIKGHHVTVISTDPLKTGPHVNYVDVDLSFTYDFIHSNVNVNDLASKSPWRLFSVFAEIGTGTCKVQLSSDVMQKFIKSAPQFDLVIIENLNYQCYYGLVHLVGSPPMIGLLSLGALSVHFDTMGSYFNPAYFPNTLWAYTDHMTFGERANNLLFELYLRYRWHWHVLPEQEAIMREYFGPGPPGVAETDRNFSMILTNNHFTQSFVLPMVPGMVELGSLHVQPTPKPLPKDLAEYLDGATSGCIYFSLGSNVRSDKMPEDKLQQFLDAFAELPHRILWKWEADKLPTMSSNVMLSKWLPQQDVLAHNNVRLFITQGGMQSIQEATANAVPMVVIPFFGDQMQNAKNIQAKNVAVMIDIQSATKETILAAVREVLGNPSYRTNIKKLSELVNDHQIEPLVRATWWVEYVLRHNGATHLRSAALDLAWYQILLLDVIAVIILTITLVALVSCWFIKLEVRLIKKAVCLLGKWCGCQSCGSSTKNKSNVMKKKKN